MKQSEATIVQEYGPFEGVQSVHGVTWDGERQQARPLSARVRRNEHAIYFLVSAEGHKNGQVERFPVVNMAFADVKAMNFVSISGTAALSNDRAKIADLWSDFDKAWWDSAEDPDIRLLTVSPERAELWDSPGRLVAPISPPISPISRREIASPSPVPPCVRVVD